MNNRPARILEIAWLVVAILGAATAIHSTLRAGVRSSIILYVITFVALLMYLFRRQYRQNRKDKE